MSVLDDFILAVRGWQAGGDVPPTPEDEDALIAPHRVIADFDLVAFGDQAEGLRSGVRVLDGALGDLDAAAGSAREGWLGRGGDGLADATERLTGDVTDLRDQLADHAQAWSLAHAILGAILGEYRLAMDNVLAPIEPGERVGPRIELAGAVGRAAATAIDDAVDVLSDGELVLAGER